MTGCSSIIPARLAQLKSCMHDPKQVAKAREAAIESELTLGAQVKGDTLTPAAVQSFLCNGSSQTGFCVMDQMQHIQCEH